MIDQKTRCSEWVYPADGPFRGSQCSRKGVVQQEDGKWFCKQHSQAEKDKRSVKMNERFEKDLSERMQKREDHCICEKARALGIDPEKAIDDARSRLAGKKE